MHQTDINNNLVVSMCTAVIKENYTESRTQGPTKIKPFDDLNNCARPRLGPNTAAPTIALLHRTDPCTRIVRQLKVSPTYQMTTVTCLSSARSAARTPTSQTSLPISKFCWLTCVGNMVLARALYPRRSLCYFGSRCNLHYNKNEH